MPTLRALRYLPSAWTAPSRTQNSPTTTCGFWNGSTSTPMGVLTAAAQALGLEIDEVKALRGDLGAAGMSNRAREQ